MDRGLLRAEGMDLEVDAGIDGYVETFTICDNKSRLQKQHHRPA